MCTAQTCCPNISENDFLIRITSLRPEPGLFLISNWNWENLRLTLPEIMGLKCFSQNAESFPLEYRVWKHDLHRFSQKFSPKNEAGDSYKKNSYIKKWCKKNSYKNGVFPGSPSVISRLRISTRLKLNSFKNRKSVNIPFLCNRLIHRSVFVKVD